MASAGVNTTVIRFIHTEDNEAVECELTVTGCVVEDVPCVTVSPDMVSRTGDEPIDDDDIPPLEPASVDLEIACGPPMTPEHIPIVGDASFDETPDIDDLPDCVCEIKTIHASGSVEPLSISPIDHSLQYKFWILFNRFLEVEPKCILKNKVEEGMEKYRVEAKIPIEDLNHIANVISHLNSVFNGFKNAWTLDVTPVATPTVILISKTETQHIFRFELWIAR